ncbi:MerR family transcriptional regulator [Desulfitobacterium sp. LBE]|uniref:HTH merR-type domain-containing protein n=5 Tax=root TaxID=1 RepID=Q24WX8_DESHY|nr:MULTISPECIES: MerR family transcriptional regulator [Desulfitobacterium]ACL20848.1 transcriptional regulator, MerR family [Desulfitobacterium hafniense DCB-2]EHL07158.1 transcriptional regulator, MerR family [Desulfitobacterium hafniense DP7]MEA5025770.1 MerR family transcriptional regulator [Desulfitobacterium hafniense]TWH56328.1 MerR family transcriptional regulator [Desulfitobacterium sp. LBE]CDX01733.1 Transcriptional regulator, MerR [Desulfitobacterium hafniense]
MKTVNEVSKLSGVSRRTLQYYDEIGLLPPSAVKESGYRQYDEESLRRLWSILFYKELGLSLDDIRLLLESPKEMEKEIMRQHKQILLAKQSALQKMILSVDRILNDEFDISMLRDFDRNRLETMKKTYANEIRGLMESKFFLPLVKSGILPGRASLVKNASNIMNLDFAELISLCGDVMLKFREAMRDGPESSAAKKAVAAYSELLNMWIPCDDTVFRKIGQAYSIHKEALDKKSPGLAEFVSKAILHVYQ